jgi:hypothetical protein
MGKGKREDIYLEIRKNFRFALDFSYAFGIL